MKKTVLLTVIFALIGAFCLPAGLTCAAGEIRETAADGVNVTRWADLLIVYKDIPTTGQNEWGHNVVVSADGIATKIILGGDIQGKDLAVPEGGMVVSATGVRVDWLKENIQLGDFVRFDEMTGRVMVSDKDEFDICYEKTIKVTTFNSVRYAGYTVVYDRPGQTGTNPYGYEISVSADGIIIASGGNDSTVPDGGFVFSAIEPEDKLLLKTYGVVGADCKLSSDKKSVTITYDDEAIKRSARLKTDSLREKLNEAHEKLALIDRSAAKTAVDGAESFMNANDITTYAGRAKLYEMLGKAELLMNESKSVELRGVWYEPLESKDSEVEKIVKLLADNGINQLCLGLSNGRNTIIPLPDTFPFRQKAALRGYDLLGKYVSECHKYGIEVVICCSVFHNSLAQNDPEWLCATNTGNGEEQMSFFSPACDEFCDYYISYLSYILENYDIDGVQLDYIRYPYFNGTDDYGYDETTKAKFAAEYGVDASVVDEIGTKLTSHELWNDWINFKSGLVTDMVECVGELVREKRPDVYLSACLAADYYTASYCQNGKEWVEKGLVDAVYPMSYGAGIMKTQTEYFSSFDAEYYCFEGSGSYMSFSKDEQLRQVLETREYGADGIVFFELSAYIRHYYNEYLSKSAFSEPALSPTYNAKKAAVRCVETAMERIELAAESGFITQAQSDSFKDAAAEVVAEIDREGAFDALRGTIADFAQEKWYLSVKADIDFAEKIVRLSKDAPEQTDESTNAVSDSHESETETDDTNGSLLWIAAAVLFVIALAVTVMLIWKKK